MATHSKYLNFLKTMGKPLSEINPGSEEVALRANDALKAIELLNNTNSPILGGDIFSSESGKLGYAQQLWGAEYHYLNWYCDELENESKLDYFQRSKEIAKNAINKAIEISNNLKKECFVVLVV